MAAPKIEYKDDTESGATTVRDAAPAAPGAPGSTTARIVLDELEAAGDRRQERPTFNRLLDSHAREALGEPFQGVVPEHGPTQTLPIVAVERAPLPQVTARDLEPPAHMTQPPAPSADASTLTTAASIEAVVPGTWPSTKVKVAAGVVSAVTFVVVSILLARAVVESPVAGQPSLSHATPATAALVAPTGPTGAAPAPAASQPAVPSTATTLAPPASARSARPVSSTPSSRPSSGAAKPASTFQGTIVEEY